MAIALTCAAIAPAELVRATMPTMRAQSRRCGRTALSTMVADDRDLHEVLDELDEAVLADRCCLKPGDRVQPLEVGLQRVRSWA